MNINEAFPSNYIKASDLKGRDVPVTIDRVEVESVGKDKDQKPIIYFRGKEKGLVLNKTNSNAISKLYGSDTDNWVGQAIIIFPTETEFGGETVECIRVRLKSGNPPKPKAEPVAAQTGNHDVDDSSIPF